ncbi:hypothetical protein [Novipirellula rosea]|uniref:Integrase catalytic domain-containing protein n=1 Tax=Novipirellula rosea TaxID=1031540 RepID=A0ABP8NL19_9BACT
MFRLIETHYNTNRIHQTLNDQTPDEFERAYELTLATSTNFPTVRQSWANAVHRLT